jgi:glutaredoxin
MNARIVLYTKPGCHLCEQVEGWLLEVGAAWQAVDITADAALYVKYRDRIPVIDLDGREVLAAPIMRAEVRRVLTGE